MYLECYLGFLQDILPFITLLVLSVLCFSQAEKPVSTLISVKVLPTTAQRFLAKVSQDFDVTNISEVSGVLGSPNGVTITSNKAYEVASMEGFLIHDTEDLDALYKHAESMHQNWENSKLFTTSGFGHKLRDISVVNEVVAFFD
jgi:hypothetical protein